MDDRDWVNLQGLDKKDPNCILKMNDLIDYIDNIGFVPLFRNRVKGFSVEEHTCTGHWWSDDPKKDPWIWRQLISKSKKIAYGKFFNNKAGYISLKWLPIFANYRRDGYDFDSFWDEGKAEFREKLIMDLFLKKDEYYSYEAKREAGFGEGGYKNFDGTVTELMMKQYIVNSDFRCRINKKGEEYGWHIAIYSTPEKIWGYDMVTSAYTISTEKCAEMIINNVRKFFPDADDDSIRKEILC